MKFYKSKIYNQASVINIEYRIKMKYYNLIMILLLNFRTNEISLISPHNKALSIK